MTDGILTLGTRRYSSWSMRGWLAVRLAGLDVEDRVFRLGGADTAALRDATPSGLVPALEHRGVQVWDSLAICEYCAEIAPSLWPGERPARSHARAVSAEMHAGFRALRLAMPMNLGRPDYAALGPALASDAGVSRDLARIAAIWEQTRARFGQDGPFLFGAAFGAADAMYAPVAARLLTYRPPMTDETEAYCQTVRAHPLVAHWYELAAAEPAEWQLDKYESLLG